MSDEAVVVDLNRRLEGSPYALPTDESGIAKARFLLSESRQIEIRQRAIEFEFAHQTLEIRQRLDRIVRVQQVFESNALESAGLDLADTGVAILRAGNSIEQLATYMAQRLVREDQHLLEVLGLEQALLFATQISEDFHRNARPIQEIDVRNLHRFTLPMERHAGAYKSHEVKISGSLVTPSSVIDVQEHMRQLVAWLNRSQFEPPLGAAVVHSWLTIIHPFEDGNGRVARLLANIVLLGAGWPPLIVRASDRLQYLDALSHSDEAGDILPLFDLFVKSIKRSLQELESPELAHRLFEVDLRGSPEARYDLWRDLLSEFLTALASSLRRRHGDFEVQRVGEPPASSYLLLEERNPAGDVWLAKVRNGVKVDLLLSLGGATDLLADHSMHTSYSPSIFVSPRERDPAATTPYRSSNHSPLLLDEISIRPTTVHDSVEIRYDTTVIRDSVENAAEILAREIWATSEDDL